jgi:hypothetical protein
MDPTIVSDLLRIAQHDRNHCWEKEAILKERAAKYIQELEEKILELEKNLKKQKALAKKANT